MSVEPGRVKIIAEMSSNHCQNLDIALDIVREVARCGADVIKTQTYKASTLTLHGPSADYVVDGGTPWDGQRLEDLYKKAEMPWEFNAPIKQLAEELGLGFLSTAYDPTSVEHLEKLGVTAYKVASFDLTDLELLGLIGQTKKRLFLSTGLASLSEIDRAVGRYMNAGGCSIVLLVCCTAYPAPFDDMNVRRITSLMRTMHPNHPHWVKHEYGLSDHSMGHAAACAAVALGATYLEKHAGYRPRSVDSSFSAGEYALGAYVNEVRATERVLGTGEFIRTKSEFGEIRYRKSMYFVRDIAKGEVIKREDLGSYRPALGRDEHDVLWRLVGQVAMQDIKSGEPVQSQMVTPQNRETA